MEKDVVMASITEASKVYPFFKEKPFSQQEYWQLVRGIRSGAPGYERLESSGDTTVWRVFLRGEMLVVKYSRTDKVITEFLKPGKYLRGIVTAWKKPSWK